MPETWDEQRRRVEEMAAFAGGSKDGDALRAAFARLDAADGAERRYRSVIHQQAKDLAALRRRVAALEGACWAVVEQLSPSVVPVVINPDCEPYAVKLVRATLSQLKGDADE